MSSADLTQLAIQVKVRTLSANALTVLLLASVAWIISKLVQADSPEQRFLRHVTFGWFVNLIYLTMEIALDFRGPGPNLDGSGDAIPVLLRFALILSTVGSCAFLVGGIEFIGQSVWIQNHKGLAFIVIGSLLCALFFTTGLYFTAAASIGIVVNAVGLWVLGSSMRKLVANELSDLRAPYYLVFLPIHAYSLLQLAYFSSLGFIDANIQQFINSLGFLLASFLKVLHLFGISLFWASRSSSLVRQQQQLAADQRELESKQRELQQNHDFIAEMAHELGTPMANLNLQLETFEHHIPHKFDQKKLFDDIKDSSALIEAIVYGANQWILHEKAASKGIPRLQFSVCSVNDLLQAAVMNIKSTLGKAGTPQAKKPDFQAQFTRDVSVYAQAPRLVQVFINILKNSYESFESVPTAQLAKPSIRIESRRYRPHTGATEQVLIRLSDNGKGVPAHVLRAIQSDGEAVSTKGPGRGQGILLANRTIREHNGTLTIRSPLNGDRGTQVEIVLPRAIFRLTNKAIAGMASDGVSEGLLSRVKPLVGQEFENPDRLLEEIAKVVPGSDLQLYRTAILIHARPTL